MLVSYCRKRNKNFWIALTGNSKLDLREALRKKPVVIDFYSSQKWGDGIVNQMLGDYTCHPSCDSWVLVVY